MTVYDGFRTKKIPAFIMGLFLSFVVLFSAFYIAAEAEHECSGEDCPICVCIHQCEQTLHRISCGIQESVVAFVPVILLLLAVFTVMYAAVQETLVSEKVRLND